MIQKDITSNKVLVVSTTGRRYTRNGELGDFDVANKAAKLDETPEGYVWHHMDDFDPVTGECSMQLVRENAHNRVAGMAHSGSVAQYKAYYINSSNAPNGLFYD